MRQRQHNGESQTTARRIRSANKALMRPHHGLRDGKPQTGSALGPRTRRIGGEEPFEQLRTRLRRHARPVIFEAQHRIRGSGGHALPHFRRVQELP